MAKKFIQCASLVKKDAIRRESRNGVDHIIVRSTTLPDNIVMKGVLYPGEVIANRYKGLEKKLAPIEHPKNSEGVYISANDPEAIHANHAGAFNENVTRKNGIVHVDKVINVDEAEKTERGRELLERVNELETNSNARPIHTSIAMFYDVEVVDPPQVNQAGDTYTSKMTDFYIDHDAILLSSVGAAQPHQNVGMAVNSDGSSVGVERTVIDLIEEPEKPNSISQSQLNEKLHDILSSAMMNDWLAISDIVDDQVIFETQQGYFKVPFVVSDDKVQIVGIPIAVDRNVTFTPKTNSDETGDKMKEMIVNALREAGVETEGLTDEKLFEAYNTLQANHESSDDDGASDDNGDIAQIIANAIKPLQDEVIGLKSELTANADNEKNQLADFIVNSKKYPGLKVESAKALPIEDLKEMAANCGESHGLMLGANGSSGEDDSYQTTEMPD